MCYSKGSGKSEIDFFFCAFITFSRAKGNRRSFCWFSWSLGEMQNIRKLFQLTLSSTSIHIGACCNRRKDSIYSMVFEACRVEAGKKRFHVELLLDFSWCSDGSNTSLATINHSHLRNISNEIYCTTCHWNTAKIGETDCAIVIRYRGKKVFLWDFEVHIFMQLIHAINPIKN